MKTTLQMEFLLCQATGLLSQAKGAFAIRKLLALLELWGVVQVGMEKKARCDTEVTCSALAVAADSRDNREKWRFRGIRYLHPSILGIDTDNSGEFINEVMVVYCEQITFTRGRPYQKRDQCFVEQKNGAIVRQVVGYDRFVGEHAYRQLTELYRALRLYVNCFQPSMKLLSKQRDGKKVRCVYDPAKTPLQRLLQSRVLPAQKQQELLEGPQALDPIRLVHQVEQLQQAIFRCAVGCSPFISSLPSAPLRVFSAESYMTGTFPIEGSVPDPTAGLQTLYREQERRKRVPGWRRTHKDPFEGEWEQIMSWVMANPERSSGDIFRELQRRSPGCYQPLQIRTLQRGIRKIRAFLLETLEEQWQDELIHGPLSPPISPEARATRSS